MINKSILSIERNLATEVGSISITGMASGVPVGGTTGQILAKRSDNSYDTHWINQQATSTEFLLQTVYNGSGVTINKGEAVYIAGAQGNAIVVSEAIASLPHDSEVIGVALENIINGGYGSIVIHGIIDGLNTDSFSEGDRLYLSAASYGQITNVEPSSPNHAVLIGYCVKKDILDGAIYVNVNTGEHLKELHDVNVDSAIGGQYLFLDNDQIWKNKTIEYTDVSGLSGVLSGFYPASNPSGFITGVNLANYITTSQTGAFYAASNPSGFITGIENLVYTTGDQSISGSKIFENLLRVGALEVGLGTQTPTLYMEEGRVGINNENPTSALDVSGLTKFSERPFVNGTGVLLSGEAYPASNPSGFITGVDLSSYITNSQTGLFYAATNPSGFITGISNLVYTTGDQAVSGVKSFTNDVVFKDNLLYISQPSGFLTGVGFTGAYDGGYFLGKQSIFNSKIDLSSIGSNLTKSNLTRRKWQYLAMSCDGKYQTVIPGGYDSPIISNDYGKTWADSKGYIPNGGYSVAMSCDGKNQYTTSNGLLFKSTNYGIDWQSTVNLPSNSAKYTATSADGKYVTVAIGNSFIRRSENYGIAVQTVGISSSWSSVAVSSDGRYQTAGNWNGEIYISQDYGKNWILAESTIAMPRFISMSADGKYQTAVAYLNKIYISKNYGLTWVPKESNRAWTCVAMSHDGKIQIATSTGDSLPEQGRLFVSIDYGENWIEKGTGPYLSVAISSDGKYLSAGMDSSPFFPFYGDIYTSTANEKIDGGFTADNIYGSNIVYNTGDQNVSGIKDFSSRPTVNGIGVLLTGEAVTPAQTGTFYPASNPSGFITGVDLSSYVTSSQTGAFYPASNPSGFITDASNLVYTTGNQTISGIKTFEQGFEVGSMLGLSTLYVLSGAVGINNENPQASLDVSGLALFSQRPIVNTTGVMLSGDIDISNFYPNDNPSGYITGIQNLVYTTGDQTISGIKTFTNNVTILGNFAVSGTTYINEVIDVTTTGIISGVTGVFQHLEADNIVYSQTNSYVVAQPGDDLIAKYAEAAALTPNGSVKSTANRASLIIMPGNYALSAELAVNVEFVDIVGLGAQAQKPAVLIGGNTLNVIANDVRIIGISVGTQAFKISSDKPLQVFENCVGGNNSFGGADDTASGTFTNCVGGSDCFAGNGGIAGGIFTNCIGGLDSFGGEGTTNGIFINCTITVGTFNVLSAPASGTARMINCIDANGDLRNGQQPL